MTYVDRDISDQDLLKVVWEWISLLSAKRYDDFFDALGYSMGGDSASADWIESDLKRYRSDFYPGVTEFFVTDWETAEGGYPNPVERVVWYRPNETRLAAAVSLSLPLNGRWSDATADFILIETGSAEGLLLKLEEICIPVRDEDA